MCCVDTTMKKNISSSSVILKHERETIWSQGHYFETINSLITGLNKNANREKMGNL